LRRLPLVSGAVLAAPRGVPAALTIKALDIVRGARDPYDEAVKLQNWFRQGSYSDGGPSTNVPPGHSIARLEDFFSTVRPVGDAEQYAAGMGLMARLLDMPVRLVVGFRPSVHAGRPTVLRGRDVDAWVEIDFQGAGWVSFYPTPPRTHTATQLAVAASRPKNTTTQPPPPTTVPAPNGSPRLSKAVSAKPAHRSGSQGQRAHRGGGAGTSAVTVAALVAGAIALVIFIPAMAILGLKAGRRRARRRRSSASAQVAAAWDEVLDRARDMGLPTPRCATRKEAAGLLTHPAPVLAAQADTAIFGPDDPTAATSAAVWSLSSLTVRAMRARLARPQRVRAAFSLASLRPRSSRR
jgi:hypothetical protein